MTTVYLTPEEGGVLKVLLSLDLESLGFDERQIEILNGVKAEVEGPTDEDSEIDHGWDCPESPDKKCHYFTNEAGKVVLKKGVEVDPPQGHDSDNESDDWCIFCGAPEERK
jgi:hypothetical protein